VLVGWWWSGGEESDRQSVGKLKTNVSKTFVNMAYSIMKL